MKKILVVLLILAVTTGAFAQWTIGANGKLATRLTFSSKYEDLGAYNTVAVPNAGAYGETIATVDLGYTRGIFSSALSFRTAGFNGDNDWQNARFRAQMTINGTTYFFRAQTRVNTMLTGEQGIAQDALQINQLFGWYKLVNGLVHLEASLADWSGVTWMADNAVDRNIADKVNDKTGRKYALVNLVLPVGFEAGVYANRLFQWNAGNTTNGGQSPAILYGTDKNQSAASVFGNIVVGMKFNISPFVVAAQFTTRDYMTYFGATGTFGPISAGLSFWGAFPDTNIADIRVGGNVAYNGGFFGVNLKAVLGIYKADDGDWSVPDLYATGGASGPNNENVGWGNGAKDSELILEPQIWINAIPAYLRFTLDAGFYFVTPRGNPNDETVVDWKISPKATWNFLGTGAGTWNTGFYLGYEFRSRLFEHNYSDPGRNADSFMKIGFQWSL